MPRNGSGTYTLPEAAFTPGSTISSAAMNSDLSDIALALTDSIAADGQTPITGAFRISDGSALLPSYSFITNSADGIHHPGVGQIAVACDGVDTLTIEGPSATAGGGLVGVSSTILVPIGMLVDFAGANAPTGWFLCYGQAVSRATYSELFDVIGTTWGSGDGSTTFNLPDLRGRIGVGKDNMGGSAANRITAVVSGVFGNTLGSTGGEQGHTLTKTETPSGLITLNDPGHKHSITNFNVGLAAGSGSPTGWFTGGANQDTTVDTTGITLTDNGGNAIHNNVQPTAIINKIIFAGHP